MVIGGIILVFVHHLNININTAAATKTMTTTVQQNVTSFTDVLEYDLRKIGYNAFAPSIISVAESTKIRFKGDFDNNNTVDSVYYYMGTTSDPKFIDARSRVVYRQLNAGPVQAINLGMTRFRFWYFDGSGNPLVANPAVSNPLLIRTIKVGLSIDLAIQIEPFKKSNGTLAYDTTYSNAAWERTIKPVNLR
jgi:hypothetical protein